jgi:transmembrane sensor
MPFKIDVNGKQVVEVLGTHFNITAYADDEAITTTLLEGSVKVNYKNKATLIKPGQMAVNTLGNAVMVKQANIDEVMAWKNDSFIFNNENITSIMKKISRWYDVDVIYKGDMSRINFDGNYSRSKGLASLLKNIELVDKVRFVTEERRITVIAK